jgi:hypothetical protein
MMTACRGVSAFVETTVAIAWRRRGIHCCIGKDRRQNDRAENEHGRDERRLRVFQNHLQNDISGVAAAIDHFLE